VAAFRNFVCVNFRSSSAYAEALVRSSNEYAPILEAATLSLWEVRRVGKERHLGIPRILS